MTKHIRIIPVSALNLKQKVFLWWTSTGRNVFPQLGVPKTTPSGETSLKTPTLLSSRSGSIGRVRTLWRSRLYLSQGFPSHDQPSNAAATASWPLWPVTDMKRSASPEYKNMIDSSISTSNLCNLCRYGKGTVKERKKRPLACRLPRRRTVCPAGARGGSPTFRYLYSKDYWFRNIYPGGPKLLRNLHQGPSIVVFHSDSY